METHIIFDNSELLKTLNAIASKANSFSKGIPDDVIAELDCLRLSLRDNITIFSSGTAPKTRDHILRIGVSRDFKLRASAFCAIE